MKRILKKIKDNLPLVQFIIITGLLIFPVWSHVHQSTQIDELVQITGNPGEDQLLGGITRVAVGTGVKWTTDLVPSASYTVNLGSLALPVNYIFCVGASLSGNLNFNGELKPDGILCSNGEILKKTGANDWDCAADADSGAAGAADSDVPFVTIGNTASLSFERALTGTANQITVTDGGANGAVTLSIPSLLVGTGASFSYGEFTINASASAYIGEAFASVGDCNDDGEAIGWTTTGIFICNTFADADIPDAITVSGGTIGANNISSGVTWTTLGTLTIGDGGDRIDFATDTWDLAAGIFSGVLGMTGTGVYDFGGATSFEIPQNGTVNATGEITVHTTSKSFDWYDGSRIVVEMEKVCKTFVVDSPTAANPGKVGPVRFDDPFTITSVQPVASGSNAAGWNLRYGAPGSITTSVFTLAKSASTSTYPTYTSFANSTLTDGQ